MPQVSVVSQTCAGLNDFFPETKNECLSQGRRSVYATSQRRASDMSAGLNDFFRKLKIGGCRKE
jgi:hypothetical protein